MEDKNELVTVNEFKPTEIPVKQNTMMAVEATKEIAEVQAAVIMAKQYPRDKFTAFNNILEECDRASLASEAVYAYPRGGNTVSGPSIRLAEVMARNWGNLDSGIKELARDKDKSVCLAFSWDLETNSRFTKTFEVPHIRYTKKGSYKLTDPRDIYENVANQGARRLRACILQAIPGDVTDAAVKRCKETMTAKSGESLVDRIRKMVSAFKKHGVTQQHIEKRMGHKIDITTEEELFDLRTVYNSIKDNQSKRSDFFDIKETTPSAKTTKLKEKIAGSEKKEISDKKDDMEEHKDFTEGL